MRCVGIWSKPELNKVVIRGPEGTAWIHLETQRFVMQGPPKDPRDALVTPEVPVKAPKDPSGVSRTRQGTPRTLAKTSIVSKASFKDSQGPPGRLEGSLGDNGSF